MLKNYYQPTPNKYRKIGDAFLAMIPVLIGIIKVAPNLTANQQYWWVSGCTLAMVFLKVLTNFATDSPSQPSLQATDTTGGDTPPVPPPKP